MLRRVAVHAGIALAVGAPNAFALTPRDGLPTLNEVPGARTVSTARSGARSATRTFRSGGPHRTVVTARATLARSPAAARTLARRAPRARTWRDGRLVGTVTVAGLAPARARVLAREIAARVSARLRAARRRTPWERITALAGGHGPTTRQAQQAFSTAFEQLPGVPAPKGTISRPADGTLALQWALARLRSMTPAQRAVVRRWAGWLNGAPATAGTARAHAARESDWKENAGLTAEAQVQAQALAAKLGFPLTLALHAGRSRHNVPVEGAMAVTESTDANGDPSKGTPVSCWITVYDPGAIQTGVFRQEIFAHEVFHCYQAQMAGDIATLAQRGANGTTWVVEGGADWAACNAVADPRPEPALQAWTSTATTQLMDRVYDGVGFFVLAQSHGVDLWSRWPAIARRTTTSTAFDAAAGPEYQDLRRGWASAHLQNNKRGKVWDLNTTLPCIAAANPTEPQTLLLEDGTWDTLRSESYAGNLYRLLSDADVIHFNVQDGDVRLSSLEPRVDDAELHDRYFCTDLQTDCSCPPNSSRTGPPPQRVDADGGTILAVTGGRGGVLGNVEGMTREQYCGVKLGLIVPGRSIGDVYLGQSRRSVLRAVDGLRPTEPGTTTKTANGLVLGGGGLIGIVFQIRFGICATPALEAGGLAACRQRFPRSEPDQVASVQTSSPGYTTKAGLGPGSDAAAVVGAVGSSFCTREPGTPQDEQPWDVCRVPGPDGRATTWGFTTDKAGNNFVQAVAVFDPRAIGD